MNRKSFTLVEIMIVVAIIASLAAISIPNLIRARTSANDSLAQNTLRVLSTAAESFASDSGGDYPTDVLDLSDRSPPYLNREYCDRTISGFMYDCYFDVAGYTFFADPVTVGKTGTGSFSIKTGGIFTKE